jgi:hypothetical protein
VVETETPDHASKMIQQLISLRGGSECNRAGA